MTPQDKFIEEKVKELNLGMYRGPEGFFFFGDKNDIRAALKEAIEFGEKKVLDYPIYVYEKDGAIVNMEFTIRERLAAYKQELAAEIEKALDWYPENIFVPPSEEWLNEVHGFAVSKGHTLDAISAHMARITIKNILSLLQEPNPHGEEDKES